MVKADEVMQLLKEGKVREGLRLADKVSDKKTLSAMLTEFAGTLDWLKEKSYPSGLILLKAISLDPKNQLARYNLGVVLTDPQMLKDRKEYAASAETIYKSAIRLDPKLAPARYNLALLYYLTGRIEDAAKEYEKAVSYDPHLKDKELRILLDNAMLEI